MPNLFAGVSLALQSLLSHQAAVEVTEHNVANVNTPGYRRQEAVMKSGPAVSSQGATYSIGIGQLGTGVSIDKIRRFSTDFFDMRYRLEAQAASQYTLEAGVLQQLESQFAETSTNGLLPKLDAFWSIWQKLSVDPSNTALRTEAVDVARTLTQAINSRALTVYELQAEQDGQISQRVGDVNEIASQVARLNGEISRVMSLDEQPNDLMDQREMLLDQLGQLVGASSSRQANGEVIVSINGHVLVQGTDTFTLSTEPDAANHNFAKITWDDGQDLIPRSGELAGLLSARDGAMADQMTGLNDLAAAMITRINEIHSSGFAPGKTSTLSTLTNTVNGFGYGVLDAGQTELAGGNYTVETRFDGVNWQFRMLDSTSTVASIRLSDGSGYSSDWQNIPAATGNSITYDTGRGITVNFGGDPALYSAGSGSVRFTEQQDFFTGTDALSMKVNALILNDPNLLATAVNPNAAGDGELARMIANVRGESILNGGQDTPNEFYSGQIAKFGLAVKRAVANARDRGLVANAIDAQRQSIGGVNLNEEAANLVRSQKAFEAAARMMNAMDEMLDTIIHGMGLVGR